MNKKIRIRPSFSQAILARIEQRAEREKQLRRLHRHAAFRLGLLAIILAAIGCGQYQYQRFREEQKRLLAELQRHNAPTWAAFVKNAPDDTTAPSEVYLGTNQEGIPSTLNINSEQWSLVNADDMAPTVMANTDCQHKTIAYISDMDSARLRQTLWHEVFHAAACTHGGDAWFSCVHPTNTDHACIKHLGEFMGPFTHDNPAFINWERNW